MACLIEGYTYDIFISYRQKDNKGDGWVSEFVEALKTELESTFKEDISVYFDINQHDGLLETHDVDESLKEKLKCLIFIPILSRTYCDPKSFAWENEFKAFIEQASNDQFGLKVKLPNGNVASRVLPIHIHDLNEDDIRLCESVLNSALRGIEFIYKSPGINRPLRPSEDNPKANINNTIYRNQINKTALAINEIMQGLKTESKWPNSKNKNKQDITIPFPDTQKSVLKLKSKTKKILITILIFAILILAAVTAYLNIVNKGILVQGENFHNKISIVVNRYENNTGDINMESWGDILSDLLRGNLATSKELSVQNSQIMFDVYESIKQSGNDLSEVSQSNEVAKKLKVDYYITGNFQKISNKVLIVSSLINTKSGEVLFTKSVEGNIDADYKVMMDSLSRQIKNFLEIKALEQNISMEYQEAFTNSVEAYRKYIEGMKLLMNDNFEIAAKTLEEAYRIDTTFTYAAFFCSFAYCYIDHYKTGHWEQIAYPYKNNLTEDYQLWLEFWHAFFTTKNKNDIDNYCNSIEKSATKSRFILFDIGYGYMYLDKYDKSISMFEKVEKVSSEWGEPWKYKFFYVGFANACYYAGKHNKEGRIIKTGMKLFPDDVDLLLLQARLALVKRRKYQTRKLIDKYEYLCKRLAKSDSEIKVNLAFLFEEVDSLDRAEKYFRQALALDPDNPYRLNSLALFLIENNRNIDEGLELVNKALIKIPNDFNMLDTKGWGLYKHGKFEEALNYIQKSYDLCPSYLYSRLVEPHLEAAKKTVDRQK
jgi:tetratricopeptide (TPR) repeat protein/TolB-like protein